MKGARNGFTIMELLVVIGIMVLLMSLAVAGFIGIRRGAELRGGVMTVRTTMMLARQEAVTKRRNVTVEFKAGTGALDADKLYVISSCAGNILTNSVIALPLGIQFNAAPAPITFKPSGSASGTGATSIGLIEKQGPVAGTLRGTRSVKVWSLTGITKEE